MHVIFLQKGDNMAIFVDKNLYFGAPEDERCFIERQTYDFLNLHNIPFARADHEAVHTIEACHEIEKVLGCEICKNLFLTNSKKDTYYLYLLPGEKKFNSSLVSKALGSTRLAFASGEKMEELLKITPGSVSIMGLINDKENLVHAVIDNDLCEKEYFACHPCINTSTMRFKTEDILDKFIAATGHECTFITV